MEKNNTFKLVLSRSFCRAFGILNLYYEIDHSIHGSINVIRNAEITLPRKQMLVRISMKTLPFMSTVEKEFLIDPPSNCECCTVALTGKINWSSTFIPFLALFSPIVEIIVKSIDYGKRDSLKCITTGDITHNNSFLKSSISTMLKIGAWLLGIIAYFLSLILYMRFVGLYDILYKPEIFDSFPALTGSIQDQLNGAALISTYIIAPIITFILWLITFYLYYLSERMRQQKIREISLVHCKF